MNTKIKEVLKEKGITQKELAEKLGMSEVGISKAISGNTKQVTIKKIADVLDVEPSDLLEDNILYAKYYSDKTPLKLGTIELSCYVLNDNQRVFSGRGMQKALNAPKDSSGSWLSTFVNSQAISSYLLPDVLDKFNNPIKFIRKGAGGSQLDTYGYEATLLIDLCSAIIEAYETRTYDVNITYYKQANVIIRAVAKVGIIALIDEITGYDKEKNRAKDELQKFLSTFINQEAEKWIKIFDDTFFEDIYKMRHWTWEQTSRRPQIVGRIINDIVYTRIAPCVYEELKRLNPKINGNRKYKFHQFLTSEVGKPKLKEHLASLHTLAVAYRYNWVNFMEAVNRAFPLQYQQLSLFDDMEF